jgi:hypothetical protein
MISLERRGERVHPARGLPDPSDCRRRTLLRGGRLGMGNPMVGMKECQICLVGEKAIRAGKGGQM